MQVLKSFLLIIQKIVLVMNVLFQILYIRKYQRGVISILEKQKLDPDSRETIRLMQIAVKKSPDNPEYHCILGEIFAAEGLGLNARREFNKAC